MNLQKYFNEKDYKHSLMRLLSFSIIVAAIILSFSLLALNYVNKCIEPKLIDLNVWMYIIGTGGKATQKIIETKFKGFK